MLFDDNDYYDHIFGSNNNNNDFNFDFNDFINSEPINDNPSPNDSSDVIDTTPPNPLPPLSNNNSIAYYFEDYTQLKEYVKLYYNNVRDYYILLPVDAIGAIRVDRRRRSYSNYLIPPSCILLPHP
ncbi:hypothetical protein [Human fecal virus Tarto]|nr:hypothetical protein [Human fecal virus Tarto]